MHHEHEGEDGYQSFQLENWKFKVPDPGTQHHSWPHKTHTVLNVCCYTDVWESWPRGLWGSALTRGPQPKVNELWKSSRTSWSRVGPRDPEAADWVVRPASPHRTRTRPEQLAGIMTGERTCLSACLHLSRCCLCCAGGPSAGSSPQFLPLSGCLDKHSAEQGSGAFPSLHSFGTMVPLFFPSIFQQKDIMRGLISCICF